MQKETLKSNDLGEKIIVASADSGLKILICEKKDFNSSFAIFGTRYGSVDTKFCKPGEEPIEVPEGIAHFLEHKLFENEDGDTFEKFAKTGASANAYTSFDRTCYLFGCVNNFKENLEILLDFVSHPYFTKETVEKEQGIIGQEIKMYDDVPNWCVFFNLLSALYHNHPVKINIAGTVDSIAKITDKLLYSCYNTFYNMSNMFLCIAGNVDADVIFETVEKILPKSKGAEICRSSFDEPKTVKTEYIEQDLPVSMPLFAIGIKGEAPEKQSYKNIVLNEMILDLVIGSSSDLYSDLLNEKLINKSFETEYFFGGGYSALLFQGQSNNPKAVLERIKAEIIKIQQNGVDKELFEGLKKDNIGKCLTDWDNPEDIVSQLVDSIFAEELPFDEIKAVKSVTLQEIENKFKEIDLDNISLSVIIPKK